jgi:hypothetical protein
MSSNSPSVQPELVEGGHFFCLGQEGKGAAFDKLRPNAQFEIAIVKNEERS